MPANLAGLPAISMPIGLGGESKLPVGFQVTGPAFGEEIILRVAHQLEKEYGK